MTEPQLVLAGGPGGTARADRAPSRPHRKEDLRPLLAGGPSSGPSAVLEAVRARSQSREGLVLAVLSHPTSTHGEREREEMGTQVGPLGPDEFAARESRYQAFKVGRPLARIAERVAFEAGWLAARDYWLAISDRRPRFSGATQQHPAPNSPFSRGGSEYPAEPPISDQNREDPDR